MGEVRYWSVLKKFSLDMFLAAVAIYIYCNNTEECPKKLTHISYQRRNVSIVHNSAVF